MKSLALIGGFFELDLGPTPVAYHDSLASFLHMPNNPNQLFINARSAFSTFLSIKKFKHVWLPAYICPTILHSFTESKTPYSFYPLDKNLQADINFLDQKAQPMDLVFVVNYFGCPPSDRFIKFTKLRQDLIFLEDCVQTIESGIPPWGDWCLYSPRKIAGIADGGYIISHKHDEIVTRSYPVPPSILSWSAPLLRFEDEENELNTQWHKINQDKEAAMSVSNAPMSRLSREILKRISSTEITDCRKTNYQILYQTLHPFAFLSEITHKTCPFGFVIRLTAAQRTKVRNLLIENRIFPIIHWENLPCPADQFPLEHQLSTELLTLPCDQRYKVDDMHRMAQLVLQALA